MSNNSTVAQVDRACQKCMKNKATQRVLKTNGRDFIWVCNRCAEKAKPSGWF